MSSEDYLIVRRGSTTISRLVEKAKSKGLKSIVVVSRKGSGTERLTIRISGAGYRWA
ncbi:MAG: hypothetical protein KGH98_03400 [Candidatus Micrarchaeota archaeon]|nr:hypothetical protein [Candidatus Micrarchaeota archaeon]